jgi:AGZA family xanthine/uracil permease-like MFS transporter
MKSSLVACTALAAGICCILMGLIANFPLALASGMGLNAAVAAIAMKQGSSWQIAMGLIVLDGVVTTVLVLAGLREAVMNAIPRDLRLATAAGIGLLLTFIGLRNAGLIEPDAATMVRLGTIDYRAALLLFGLVTAVVLMRRRSPLAFLASIFGVTLFSWAFGYAKVPGQIVSLPDFSSVALKLDVLGALRPSLLPALISIVFTDLFDSLSTFIGVATAAGLTEPDGRPLNLRRGLIVDAFATFTAGLAGTSSGTAYVESIAGIRMGGRTGLTSVVTALCFLPCFFVAPLAAAVPTYATAPVLVLVGVAMFQMVSQIDFSAIEDALPAFVTLVLIPLTFSITQGILCGFILHALLYACVGRWREVPVALWLLAALSAVLLFLR